MPAKSFLVLVISIFTITGVNAQQTGSKIKVPKPNSSVFLLSRDSSLVRFDIAKNVAEKLGMQKLSENAFSTTYGSKTGLFSSYFSYYVSQPFNPAVDSYIQLHNNKLDVKANTQQYLYGFASATGEGKRVDRNYSRMMMSAYLQEISQEYTNNTIFSSLNKLNKSEFWKRNWINMGYGFRYATKDSPFASGSGFAAGFLYVLETLHYVPIFGGAFIGETTSDKILIPISGIVSLIIWKGIVGGICKKYININNNILNSGYRIPNNFEY